MVSSDKRKARAMATKARITAEDLWQMPHDEGHRELINGGVVEVSPAGGLHGGLVVEVAHRLTEHARRHGEGAVVTGTGFILQLPYDPERVREPDVAFISAGRLEGGKLPQKFIRGAPDLVVEVISPSDRSIDIQQKVRDFLEAGARMIWVLAPGVRTATVYRADGSARLLRETEQLEGEDVLPGLIIPLAELFG